jgi:hypothetical protein
MTRNSLIATMLAIAVCVPGRAAVASGPADVIVEWNQILQDTLPASQGVQTPRYFAMMHIAMFDAANAIERDFDPYRVSLRYANGSPRAAAAQAAHDVLVALNPSATATYDAALVSQLGQRPSGYIRLGAAVGAKVAQQVLAWRQNDGWVVAAFPPYSEPPLPGRWQPAPPANAAAAFTHLQHAAPMALLTSTQFLPDPPPSITSDRYATDLNEVMAIGGVNSVTRTPDQTFTARLWAGIKTEGGPAGTATGFFSVWNNAARDVARQRHLSLVETARVFALVNVSMHDALQTTQASKFVFGLWRPVTAAREADNDLNPATAADPTWLPLLPTPPYPSYAGNLATIGASAARALQFAFGTNDIPISITWRQVGGPDVSHHFAGFSQAADEMSESRILGGIHYRFDQEAGQRVGRQVADYVAANYMTPRRGWND